MNVVGGQSWVFHFNNKKTISRYPGSSTAHTRRHERRSDHNHTCLLKRDVAPEEGVDGLVDALLQGKAQQDLALCPDAQRREGAELAAVNITDVPDEGGTIRC
jgi:hypothetical protein